MLPRFGRRIGVRSLSDGRRDCHTATKTVLRLEVRKSGRKVFLRLVAFVCERGGRCHRRGALEGNHCLRVWLLTPNHRTL